jgi:NAD(P)-dependent dehydrogenase (short-subunit alcohol dehydrogenase family)
LATANYENKVVLVTGAAQGMGKVIAETFAARGATVVVNDRTDSVALRELAGTIGGHTAVADVSNRDEVIKMFKEIEGSVGSVDVLISNHAYMSMGAFVGYDHEDWWKVVNTNLSGTFWLIQSALDGMRKKKAGRIVVICSGWGVIGWPEATAYSASKAGLISLVKTLGRELGPENIVVNGIAPGVVDTPQLQVDADAAKVSLAQIHSLYAEDIPLGRIGLPIEIAHTAALLADFRIRSLVGQIVQVNGAEIRGRV